MGNQVTLKGPSQVRVPFNVTLAPRGGRQGARAVCYAAAPQFLMRADSPKILESASLLGPNGREPPRGEGSQGNLGAEIPQGVSLAGSPPKTLGGLHLPKWGFVRSGPK